MLRRAQRQHPGDFWVNFQPALCLSVSHPGECVRFNTAAVALRPSSSAAHNNLGVGLIRKGDVDGAVAAYAEAAMILRILPICGDVIGGIYALILIIIGVSEAHRISGLKATLAVLLPLLLFCCCCPALIGAVAGSIASIVGHAAQ